MIVNTLRRHNKMFERVAAATRYSHGTPNAKGWMEGGRQADSTALALHAAPWASQYAYVRPSRASVSSAATRLRLTSTSTRW